MMKVGDYVRTECGIAKIIDISCGEDLWFDNYNIFDEDEKEIYRYNNPSMYSNWADNNIIKSSPNIIDSIEEGDILKLLDIQYGKEYKAEVILDYNDNLCVIDFENNKIIDLKESLLKKDIKLLSIVTKEQFSQMEYKVGE